VNVLNRVLLIIIFTALACFAVSIIFFAWAAPASSADALDEAVDWLQDNQGTLEKTLISTGAALVALLAVTLLYLEIMPRAGSEVVINDLRVGSATLSTAAISRRVEEAVSQIRHVWDVRAAVETRRKGVTVSLDLQVDPEANLAALTDAACEAARDVLTNRVHVALIEPPTARLHYRDPRRDRPAVRRAPLPASARSSAAAAGTTPARPTRADGAALQAPRNGDLLESGNGHAQAIEVRETAAVGPEAPVAVSELAEQSAHLSWGPPDETMAEPVSLQAATAAGVPADAPSEDSPALRNEAQALEAGQSPGATEMEPRRRI
jgi:hypothetical protein